MPLTPAQAANINKVKEMLDLAKTTCPNIPRLNELSNKLNSNIQNGKLHFDTQKVQSADPSAPAYTENKDNIYIREDLSPNQFDPANPGDVGNLVNLAATLIHEMFHQLGSAHPTTYCETANFLAALINCFKQNKNAIKSHYQWEQDSLYDLYISQLEIQEQGERSECGSTNNSGGGGGGW
ncbi:MAG: hypothetical protein H6585_11455 [Flavobacteriales bacterium]|nr:hypothetical protein [Flavobacteriales bacterium]MCB9448950.1 hypothetical protein [Flavobacteriales bacterium]